MTDNRTEAVLRAVDLFCGSGAVTEALRHNGFDVVAAVDNDAVACRTYRANHTNVKLVEGDIERIEPYDHPAFAHLGTIDLLVVCAPCQPFSSQNRKRAVTDARAGLLLHSIKFAQFLKPKCILFENVPGLASPGNKAVFESLRDGLRNAGYVLSEPRRMDASALGVPQRRVRCVMVGTPDGVSAKGFKATEIARTSMTVRDAIEDLPTLGNGDADPEDALHTARVHSDLVLRRLKYIPLNGGSRSSLPAALELKCHQGRSTSFPDVYGRMHWDSVAPTLTTGCTDLTRGRFAHPSQDRAITLREAALLQTFPRSYRFEGNRTQIAKQIGNAVPVRMVEALLPTLRSLINAQFADQAS